MNHTKYFKMIVIIANMLIIQIPQSCDAYDTEALTHLVGKKAFAICLAAIGSGFFYQGGIKFFNPAINKKETKTIQYLNNEGEVIYINDRHAMAYCTKKNITITSKNSRPLFPSRNELAQSIGSIAVGTLGLGLSWWLLQE